MILKTPIAISISPNTDKDDFWLALKILFQPWKWKKGETTSKIEQWFEQYYHTDNAVSFNSGRSALFGILQTFGVGKDDEVLVQAFTCVAAIEPILWVGAKPVYADIDSTLNIDPIALEKQISKKTRAIIVQHTFGVPADIIKIKNITQKHNLILIEDCAHAFGASVKNKNVGMFGDAAYFSFGRDKVISSVFGGMAIISAKCKVQSAKLRSFQERLNCPSFFWIFQQLLHPIVLTIILPIYNLVLGKIILILLQKLHLLSKPYYSGEYIGLKPDVFPAKYPNALAVLTHRQLQKLDKMNKQRTRHANYYFNHISSDNQGLHLPAKREGAIYLRFNILINKADEIIKYAKKKGVLLGNWYKNIIDPKEVDMANIGYRKGTCPQAEKISRLSINLPTYPRLTLDQLDIIIKIINKYGNQGN